MTAPGGGHGPRGTPWPIAFQDVLEARRRLAPFLPKTPLRSYPVLDRAVGSGIKVLVKHENHNPTNSFKARNGLSLVSALPEETRRRGLVAATRGNHGLGLAWAGSLFGARVTICVPAGNNPEKNEAMRGFGVELIEGGRDYDEVVRTADALRAERGLFLAHSTNDPTVIAGAATLTLEILEEAPRLDALVIGVGGGSQAVGALVVARELRPDLKVFGVQAERASAIHDSWHRGEPISKDSADTFADGLATRNAYDMTFPALRAGLAGFVTASEGEIAAALRLLLKTTHNLAEGAGAAGLAGLFRLRETLAGKTVGVVLSGSNIDSGTLRRVLAEEL